MKTLIPAALAALLVVSRAPASPGTGDGSDGLGKGQAFAWSDGVIQYSNIINCVSIIQGAPYVERGAGAYVGFLADASASQPAPNTVYYLHVAVMAIGNACSGQRAWVDISLPQNTSLAISTTNKLYYLYDNVALSSAESPQTLSLSPYNAAAYSLPSVDGTNANTWPLPIGKLLEFQIPVISSVPLTAATFQAHVRILDGNDSPWLRPQVGVFVFSSTPSIFYSQPSTTQISTTSGHSEVTLYTAGWGGTGYFDLGLTSSYGLIRDPVTIAAGGTSYIVWDDWGPPALQPATTYHWRFSFVTSAGQTYYGADQTFTTSGTTAVAPQALTRGATTGAVVTGRAVDLRGRAIEVGAPDSRAMTGVVVERGSGTVGVRVRQ